jgi:hypothetical protein
MNMGTIRGLLIGGGAVTVAIVAGALFSTPASAAPGDLDLEAAGLSE